MFQHRFSILIFLSDKTLSFNRDIHISYI